MKENFIDVEFNDTTTNIDENIIIEGKPLYYTTTQVSQMIEEPASTVRYWTKRFDNILNVAISNKNRAYTMTNIEQLKFIKKLAKEDGLTLQQIEEYCTKKGFDKNGIIDESKPLAIKVVTESIMQEVNKQMFDIKSDLDLFKKNMLDEVKEVLIQSNQDMKISQFEYMNELNKEISMTIDESIAESLKDINSVINSTLEDQQKNIIDKIDNSDQEKDEEAERMFKYFESLEKKAAEQTKVITESLAIQKEESKRQIELFDNLRNKMDEKKKEYEAEKNKSFFSKLFNK